MARKKIYDIRPPRSQDRIPSTKGPSSILDKVLGVGKKIKPAAEKKEEKETGFLIQDLWSREALVVLGGAVLIGGFLFLHFTARAEIDVFPAGRDVSLEREVKAEVGVVAPDWEKNRLRAKSLSQTKTVKGSFEATGTSESATYASGTVRVVNNYHLEQVLISVSGRRTRFLSADGNLFYLQKTVTVPAGESREVEVKAAEPGPEYNIDPTTFSLPGLLGSPRYTAVYAESTSPMTGGSRGEVALVTEEDVNKAEEELTAQARQELKNGLNEAGGEELILPSGGTQVTIMEKKSSQEVGTAVNTFEFTVKARGDGLLYNKGDLLTWSRKVVVAEAGENEELREGSLSLKTEAGEISLEKGTVALRVGIEADVLKKIDEKELKKSLLGKKIEEAESYFSSYPLIEKAKIKISPFWVKRIPSRIKRVELRVRKE